MQVAIIVAQERQGTPINTRQALVLQVPGLTLGLVYLSLSFIRSRRYHSVVVLLLLLIMAIFFGQLRLG